ncbi:hypothetical protein [Streptomyces sp. ALI-76-A]|uniref:hypothetical protein n=1 Tax=Streptomyces sp. ALI-76-A TaxID=3025736 RepID=UPI00256EBBD2|nr:hypothetical protein [Streptomyces sp. ALI-76-A]MDL5205491.1 hypothetical protein [Streptomyces sp. ALI-76-A]
MDRHAHTPPRPDTFATRLRVAHALLMAGDPRAAADRCARSRTRAARAGARGRQAAFGALRAEALLCLGELAAAEQEAGAAVRAAVPGASLGRWPAAVLAEVLTELGRHEEADRQLCRAAPEASTRTADLPRYLRARGRHRLAVRRPGAALADFLRSGELTYRQGNGPFARMPWRTDAAEALLHLGRPDEAAELIAEQLTGATAVGPRHRGIALRLRAATEEPARRPATLALAADELRAAGDRPELARTLADLGETLHALGDGLAARAVLRRAWHLAADCGAVPLCDRILPHSTPPAALASR